MRWLHRIGRRWVLGSLACLLLVVGQASPAEAGHPKFDVKIFLTAGTTIFVPRQEGRARATPYFAWGGGLGGRLRIDKWYFETSLEFQRFRFSIADSELSDSERESIPPDLIGKEGTMYSFLLPLIAGYVPYKSPLIKVYLYGGLINHFNTRGFVDVTDDEREWFGPKDVDLAIYIAMARLGAAIDIAMFNFDVSYSINLNSATTTDIRTNYHALLGRLGYIF